MQQKQHVGEVAYLVDTRNKFLQSPDSFSYSFSAQLLLNGKMKSKETLAYQGISNVILSSSLHVNHSYLLKDPRAHPFSDAMGICSLSSSCPHSRTHCWWLWSSRNCSRHGLSMKSLQKLYISLRQKKCYLANNTSPGPPKGRKVNIRNLAKSKQLL